jgi:hypothetical protein
MIDEVNTSALPLTPETLWDVEFYKKQGLYFYMEETEEILPNGRVQVAGHGEMIMLGSYS